MKKLLTALVGLMLMATVDAYAISKSKYMVKAMQAFVGQPAKVALAKFGHTTSTTEYKGGSSTLKWGSGVCTIAMEVTDSVVQSWSIDGQWSYCWGKFVGLYHSKWPKKRRQPQEEWPTE